MTIVFLESGGSATHGLEFYSSISGSVSTTTSGAHPTSPRSVTLTGNSGYMERSSVCSDTGGRISLWFRVALLTNGATIPIRLVSIAGGIASGSQFGLRWKTDGSGILELVDAGTGTAIAAASNAVSVDTWKHLAIAWTRTSSSVNRYKLWLGDGVSDVLEMDVTNTTWTSPCDSLVLSLGSGNAVTPQFCHVYADDVSDLSYPGDIRVTYKAPNALNTNNFDTLLGSGTNRFDRVSDRPLSTTNGIQHAATSDVQENFGIQAPNQGDVDITGQTVLGYCGWVFAKRGELDTRYLQNIGTVHSKT